MALASAGVLLAAGCGVAESGDGADGTLTLWTHNAGNPAELAIVEQIVEDFNASQSDVTVEIQAFPQQAYNSAVVSGAVSRKLPCLLDTDAPNVPSWAYSGFLAPLDLPQELIDAQLPSTVGVYDGKPYSIGYYDAALAIYAHGDALEKAGVRVPTIEDPWSGEEFDEALAKISEDGDYEYAFDFGTGDTGTEWWTYAYSPWLQSFGADLIDRDAYTDAEGVLNGDKALAWARWFRGLVDKGYMPARSGTDAMADFINGKSAMVWSGSWNGAGFTDAVPDGLLLPPPDFGAGSKIGGGSWQWAVSSTCADTEAAMDYLEFSLQPKYLARFADELGVVPATEEAAKLAEGWEPGDPETFFLDEAQAFATIRPPTPGYPYLTTTFAKAAQDIVSGGDPEAILDQAVEDIQADLESNENYGY
jgi:multiple sugar transport system substrate-binding protein